MGSDAVESDLKRDLDDSGCVDDDSPAKKTAMENGYIGSAQLLDLSDDVLLCILKYLAPQDLKALGYTCSRLGSLVLERSLWNNVDARDVVAGRARARWLLLALHAGTRSLLLTGLARDRHQQGCLGHVNRTRKEVEDERAGRKNRTERSDGNSGDNNINETIEEILGGPDEPGAENGENGAGLGPPYPLFRQHARLHINAQHSLPRMSGSPSWPDDSDSEAEYTAKSESDQCPGPQFTLSRRMLHSLTERCPRLHSLHLEYCNINCNKTSIMHFPASLKVLSLRGTKCFNLPLDKSFLFKIHDYLPLIEYLDLSECSWLEPAALLPLSKLPVLRTLLMRSCSAMAEFVAYVSLATRYGFRELRELDLSGSPVGDSEVSALGWLPALERLSVSAPRHPPPPPPPPPPPLPPRAPSHYHYRGDPRTSLTDADDWELQEPEYYRHRHRSESVSPESSVEDVEEQVEQLREHFSHPDQITIEVCTRPQEAPPPARPKEPGRDEEPRKRRQESARTDQEPGPSKRVKTSDKKSDENSDGEPKAKRAKGDEVKSTDEHNQPGPSNCNKNERKSDRSPKVLYHFCRNDRVNIDNSAPRVLVSYGNDNNTASSSASSNEGGIAGFNINYKSVNVTHDCVNRTVNIRKITRKLKTVSHVSDKANKESQNEELKQENEMTVKNLENEKLKHNDELNSDDSQPSTSLHSSRTTQSNQSGSQASLSSLEASTSSKTNSEILPNSSEDSGMSHNSSSLSLANRTQSSSSSGSSSNDEQKGSETVQQYVRFRQNQDPVVLQCGLPRAERAREPERAEQAEPRHHVLYVNLGQQLHAVYRLLPNQPVFSVQNRNFRSTEHLNASSLVSDASIRHFGRADNANINIINIGPNGPQFGGREISGRPNRSSLRYLSVTGYRNVTNRSLVHLATAAPHLEFIDFTNTGVTQAGVDQFKNLRPDCEVRFREFKEENFEMDEE